MPNIIRELLPSDSIDELTALLHRAYARLGAMGLNYTAVDQTSEVTARRIRGGRCFVVVDGERLIGTIVVQPTYAENECEYFTRAGVAAVHQFAVDPGRQGEGIGRALLQRAEQWASERGFAELAMDTAEPADHLVALYNSLGYRQVGVVQWSGKVYRSAVLSKPLAGAPGIVWSHALDDVDWEEASELYRRAPLGIKSAAHLKKVYSHSLYRCFVREHGVLVAAGRALADGGDCAYLCDIAVLPSHQGTGLGKQIVERLVGLARGYRKIILYAVPGKEPFYRKAGFRRMTTAMAIFDDQAGAFERGYLTDD